MAEDRPWVARQNRPANGLMRVNAYDTLAKKINLGTAGYGPVRPGGVRAGGGGCPGYSIGNGEKNER